MLLYSYFEKGCRKKCVRDNPERLYGIWLNKIWYDRTYISCFPLALANICPWPLVPFIQIALKNSAVKTTHNTFLDCRVHFFPTTFLETSCIRHFHISHNAPYLIPPPPHTQILHKHCLQFLLGRLYYAGEMKNKGYAKFGRGRANKIHYEKCGSGVMGQDLTEHR